MFHNRNLSRLTKLLIGCGLTIALFALNESLLSTSQAQESTDWQSPVELIRGSSVDSNQTIHYIAPVMVADVWGTAHAFWDSWYEDNATGNTVGGSIFYAYNDGYGWSEPVDIFHNNRRLWLPQAAVDQQGLLHLIWEDNSGGPIMYARTPALNASDLHSWSEPQLVTATRVRAGESMKSIVATPAGEVHVAYCTEDRIEHIRLTEQNQWSVPVMVQQSDSDSCAAVRIAVDEAERLHLVYQLPMSGIGRIFYAHSDDKGQSWSEPFEIASWVPEFDSGYSPSNPTITTSSSEVHIVWLGFPRTQRWHRWSADGGETWSSPAEVSQSPVLTLRTNPPALQTTQSGILHMVTVGSLVGQGDLLEEVYYATWQDGVWSPLQKIHHEADERAALTLVNGNQLHLIWDNDEGNGRSIWTSMRTLPEATIPPQEVSPISLSVANDQQMATTTPTPFATEVINSESRPDFNTEPPPTSSRSNSLLLSFIVALFVILLGIVAQRKIF